MEKKKILVIDDEIQITRILEISFEAEDFKVIKSSNAKEGLIYAASSLPDIIILDLGLPDRDGIEVLKEIRQWSSVPIIILSVRHAEEDIVNALNSGADDYLTKPFNTSELIARIKANLRRAAIISENPVFINGELKIDFPAHLVYYGDNELKLTATEYQLLCLFAKNIGKVLTHRYILKEIWGPSYIEQSQYLRVFVSQLRKKLESHSGDPVQIITESGVGYRMPQA